LGKLSLAQAEKSVRFTLFSLYLLCLYFSFATSMYIKKPTAFFHTNFSQTPFNWLMATENGRKKNFVLVAVYIFTFFVGVAWALAVSGNDGFDWLGMFASFFLLFSVLLVSWRGRR
jgi:hypothetical protein